MDTETGERGSRAALAGIVFSLLFVIGWLLVLDSPGIDATDDEILSFYTDPRRRRSSLLAGVYVVPFAAVAFVWFLAALRDRIVRASRLEHAMFSAVQLISGTVFVTALFAVGATELAGVWMAEAVVDDAIDIDATRAVIGIGTAFAQIVALRSSAVFIAVSSTRATRAGLFPRWFGLVGTVAAGALLFVATAWRPVVLLIPLWVLGTSIIILSRRRNLDQPIDA